MTATRLWIIIVNYRTAGLAIDCLQSLAAELVRFPGLHTVVVDNASGDGSVERLQEAIAHNGWQGWATVNAAGRNGGFAYGNNVGLAAALRAAPRPDYVMLLNPDTVVHPGALRALVDFMVPIRAPGSRAACSKTPTAVRTAQPTTIFPRWANSSPGRVSGWSRVL